MMQSDPMFALAVGVVCMLLIMLSCQRCAGAKATPVSTKPPRAKRDPKPFAGFIHKPDCPLCEPGAEPQLSVPAPPAPPPRMIVTRGRRRHVDTTEQFCPQATCSYHGRVGLGNIRANGHPNGRRWRQMVCLGCQRHFLETHGTPFHGKQVEPDKLVWAIATLAEGLGIRAVARVFETDPNTILLWLVEAADHLEAFSRHFVHDLDVEQVQMDELFALLSAVKDGEMSEEQAIKRLSRSPHWVWVAMDPVSKLILAVDIGDRTLAMAQRLVHQVTQVLIPDCAPLLLTDGFREDLTALVTHYGQWTQPERRCDKGPQPKPRWMPVPELL
jgi:transposase-like protein